MSERHLVQCDNCEETLELATWDSDDEWADTTADHGWFILVYPSESDERTDDHHFCTARCLAVWATAHALEVGEIAAITTADEPTRSPSDSS